MGDDSREGREHFVNPFIREHDEMGHESNARTIPAHGYRCDTRQSGSHVRNGLVEAQTPRKRERIRRRTPRASSANIRGPVDGLIGISDKLCRCTLAKQSRQNLQLALIRVLHLVNEHEREPVSEQLRDAGMAIEMPLCEHIGVLIEQVTIPEDFLLYFTYRCICRCVRANEWDVLPDLHNLKVFVEP